MMIYIRGALYTATDWRDQASYSFHPTKGAGGEDSFIYWDGRSPPVLHMLRHTGRDTGQTAPNATRKCTQASPQHILIHEGRPERLCVTM